MTARGGDVRDALVLSLRLECAGGGHLSRTGVPHYPYLARVEPVLIVQHFQLPRPFICTTGHGGQK